MRTAQITMPVIGNRMEVSSADIHKKLFMSLCSHFGGATVVSGYGGWINEDGQLVQEQVNIYHVSATVPGYDETESLRGYAEHAARNLNQDAYYYVDFYGEAHVVNF